MTQKKLTQMQEKFLDALFGEAQGDPAKAKKIAGYSDSVSHVAVIATVRDEVYERTKDYIALHGPKAAFALVSLVDNPTQLGAKEKLSTVKDLLDRAGFKSSDKVEVKTDSPIFYLPEKKDEEEEEN